MYLTTTLGIPKLGRYGWILHTHWHWDKVLSLGTYFPLVPFIFLGLIERVGLAVMVSNCTREVLDSNLARTLAILTDVSHGFRRFPSQIWDSNSGHECFISKSFSKAPFFYHSTIIARTVLEDIWGGARRGLLRSSSLSQESGVVQLALRGT
jgi:hypothetical protein